jgi:hypothetical protein
MDQLKGDRGSYSGSAMKRHDEERAARLVEGALTQLNLTEADLETLKKGATEKCLAGEKTTERSEWLDCPSVEDGPSRLLFPVSKSDRKK